LWPNVPHQTCQFHYLREAGKQMYEYDRRIKVAMRKEINRKLVTTHREGRREEEEQGFPSTPEEQ
jgi:hypothetical protein